MSASKLIEPQHWASVVAGTLSANQYHCAIVGVADALEPVDRVNAAYWKAANAGAPGYRKLDVA
jgi:hypothetical protein